MFHTLSIIMLGLLIGINCDMCNNITCLNIPQHYRELGCKAQKSENNCCETSFDCPNFKSLDINKCHYNGREYEVGDVAPNGFADPCESSCVCKSANSPGTAARFECDELTECPTLSEFHLKYCVQEHKPEVCCSEIKCPEVIKELGVCNLDGDIYNNGETINPKSHPCYTCLCSENFDNSTIIGNPACTEVNCGFARSYIHYFQMDCVPLYFQSYGCCTVAFRCPSENDVVIKVNDSGVLDPNNAAMNCKFGNLTMNLGEELASNDPCLSCKCNTPPMLHCIRKSNCYIQTNQNPPMNIQRESNYRFPTC